MQTLTCQIAHSFLDDAKALATGAGRLVRLLTVDALVGLRNRMMAPIDRLAAACDVTGIRALRDLT